MMAPVGRTGRSDFEAKSPRSYCKPQRALRSALASCDAIEEVVRVLSNNPPDDFAPSDQGKAGLETSNGFGRGLSAPEVVKCMHWCSKYKISQMQKQVMWANRKGQYHDIFAFDVRYTSITLQVGSGVAEG